MTNQWTQAIRERVYCYKGLDVYINRVWYGLHYYWQSIPLFGIINTWRKNNTIREYGVIVFGLWIYIKIDK